MSREKEDFNWTDGGLHCGIQKKKATQLRHKVDTSKRERARRTRIRRRTLS